MSDREGEEDDLIIPPDQFRCVRSDGKQWRCKGWQYQESKYCENHHIQIKYKKKANTPKGKKPQLQVVKEEKKKPYVQKKKVQIEEEDDEEEEEQEEVKFVRKRRKVVKESYAFLDSSEEEEEEEEEMPLTKGRNENANNMKSSVEVEKKTTLQIQENNEQKKAKAMNVQIEEEAEQEEEEEKLVRKRPKVAIKSYVISDSSEKKVGEEIPLEKKIDESNENMNSTVGAAELSLVEATQLISMAKEIEECTTSELVFALKTAFRYDDFAKVEHILKMREEKILMEKKDAEDQAARLKQLLAVSGIKCAQLSNELYEKKKEITVVEGNLKDSEFRKVGIESELLQNKRMCEELQCVKSRADDEIGGLMKRVKELETQVLLQSCVSRKEYTEEGKRSGSNDSKIQSENNNALKGACLSHVKVKEEAFDCDGRVYASANVDSICHSSSRDCGVGKHAGSSANQHSPVPTVSTGGGSLENSLTPARRRLVCLRQPEDIKTGAQKILLNHFEISGTSCKESKSSIADNAKEREAENYGSTRMGKSLDTVVLENKSNGSSKAANSSDPEYAEDGITKFLSVLRRSKNSNLESKEIMKATSPSLSTI